MDLSFILLILAGFLAGLMDAAVGGGGLLQIPALFGILPNQAVATLFGTNKFASAWGTATAATQFALRVKLAWKMLLPAAFLAFVASYLGAKWVAYVPVHYMRPAMLILMILMCIYTFFKKNLGQSVREKQLNRQEYCLGLFFGALIGFYDGIFGPGTGSLLAFVFVRFFAYDFLTATASAKIINLTTNLAALSFFVPNGHILWHIAIPLAVANLCGGMVGARLAMWGGTRFLRWGFMALLCIMISKFAYDTFKFSF